jgi:hypothetical protein
MNRKMVLLLSACFLILVGLYLWARQGSEKQAEPTPGREAATDTRESSNADAETTPTASFGAPADSGSEFRGEFCNRKPACADDPLAPNSEAELRWMQQHGYPTKEVVERLSRLSDTELEAEAKRGALTAMTELGSRMLEKGDHNGAVWFIRAADRGSIYAYYAQSKYEMRKASGRGLVESGAYLRVAYILGDHKASYALYEFMRTQNLSMMELDAIDRRAASLYQTYARNRQPAPRPQ